MVTPGEVLTDEISVNVKCDNGDLENVPKNKRSRVWLNDGNKLTIDHK
jgi:hypothetical protein